jgi:hypothetical protein
MIPERVASGQAAQDTAAAGATEQVKLGASG